MTTVNQYRVWCTDTTAHYEYVWGTTAPTVCPSDGTPIDTDITTVVQSVSSSDVEVTNLPRGVFGELSVAEVTPLIQLYFTYSNIDQLVTTTTTGSGTVTNADSMGIVSSGADTSSMAAITSAKPIKYRSGQGIILRFTAIFTTGVIGNVQLAGGYDSEDGVGFGYNGSDFGVFKRSNSITNWISQTAWNTDKLDGTGPSGITIDFSQGFGNVFEIKYQYLGFGGIMYGVENPFTAIFVPVHIIQYANTATVPSFNNSSFPICIESANTTNTTDIIVKTASMMAGVEGQVVFNGPHFTDTWTDITVPKDAETFLNAYSDKTTFVGKTNKTIIYVVFGSFATDDLDRPQILRLRKNATFNAPVWTDINTNQSAVQKLTGGTWNTETGTVLLQQNVAGKGVPTIIEITPSTTKLCLVAGDNLVITLEGLGNGSSWGSIEWLEDQ